MFFTYDQNNSGGSFSFEKGKIAQYVIIEADTEWEADVLAQTLGIYFNGVENGLDCECCGDRWYEARGVGDKVPSIRRMLVEEWANGEKKYYTDWMDGNPDVYVHYLDGRVESYKKKLD